MCIGVIARLFGTQCR